MFVPACALFTVCWWGLISYPDDTNIKAGRGTVVVDGAVDDVWQAAPLVNVNKVVKEVSTLPEKDCATGFIRCLWDDEYLYFLADVQDPVISTANANDWAQDSIEIFLDQNCNRSKGFDQHDCQYRISALGNVSVGGYALQENLIAKVVPGTGGYRVEVAVKPNQGRWRLNQKIGIEFQVNNDPGSGQRESVTKWKATDNDSWFSTANYGTLELVERPQPEMSGNSQGPKEKNDSPANSASEMAADAPLEKPNARVPAWAADAVFYQIFPERFRNGDLSNDPTRESLEFPDAVPAQWVITPWTSQWYARADWEREMGTDFYEHGVFHRRYGGDLQGIISTLDYLTDLGINAIYLNPVFYARSLHKYDGNSFHHIDPFFGPDPAGDLKMMQGETPDPQSWHWTKADRLFLTLVEQAHRRQMRVIIDGVFNHTGRDFFAFQDLVRRQQNSPYAAWYLVESFDDPKTEANEFKYKGWWGVQTLPEFSNNAAGDDLHADPKEYIMQATARWMDPNGDGDPVDGIDGWRLDVANELPNQFWRDWHQHVRRLNPAAYTVSEIWDNAANYLRDCGFSATMNYHGFSFAAKGFLVDGRMPASRFTEVLLTRMEEHDTATRYALQNLFDSHDTDRLASMIVNARHNRAYVNAGRFDYDIGERVSPRWFREYDVRPPGEIDKEILKLATLFQMTFVGAPMLYYGTETGMDGGDDPDDRLPMVWDDLSYEPRSLGPYGPLDKTYRIQFDRQLFQYMQRVIRLRRENRALTHGTFEVLHTDDRKKTVVFSRAADDHRLLVAINRSEETSQIDLSKDPQISGENLELVFSTRSQPKATETASRGPQAARLEVPPLSGLVWRVQE